MPTNRSISNPEVAAVFDGYPREIRSKLMFLRQLIFDVASRTNGVGELEETLKWGQPSYATTQTGSGSPVRIDQIKSREGQYAMYFHCQTTLVDSFREMYRDQFAFGGNRSLIFDVKDRVPIDALSHCIAMALTYHRDKKGKNRSSGIRRASAGPARHRRERHG
jgi:hypothetical protein